MTFDLTKITKTSSSFEVRTWDPEGVIFYGDTNPKDDWFMLGLRDGRPEIQLHNHWAQLTVGAGPQLDDGRWHQLVPALDGCLRRDSWLDKQAEISASAPTSLRSCDVESNPGIFLPPGTHAEFNLRGEDSSTSFCLNGLWAQGQRLDVDLALNRSHEIWTHSCPQSPGNGTGASH
ncbi:SHBG isoform 15 [Pongo abelii]|uniref:Sex hormone-binding globulin n=2 Tax=Pongo abelii TaxID=9601 RepID=A0A2J8RWJ0_PONAB|nr:SHBG isoform 15 [Pongo abelii]